MPEIKFRAFDKEAKVMRIWEPKRDWNSALSNPFKDREYHVMQFTGLRDNNGKEIYEGDIVSFISNPFLREARRRTGQVRWDQRDCRFRIVFNDDETSYTGLTSVSDVGLTTDDPEDRQYEVIGNIYENPELLGSSNDHV